MNNHFAPITEGLVDRLSLQSSAAAYERDARSCRLMAGALHPIGLEAMAQDYDAEAVKLEARARDIRKFLRGQNRA